MGYGTWQDSPLTSGTEPFRPHIYTSRGFDIRGERIGQEEETVCGQWAQQWCDYRLTHHPYAFASLFRPQLRAVPHFYLLCIYVCVISGMEWNGTHMHAQQKRNYTHSVYHTHTHKYKHTHVCKQFCLLFFFFFPQHLFKVKKKLRRHTCCMLKNVLVWIFSRIFRSIPQHCARRWQMKCLKSLWDFYDSSHFYVVRVEKEKNKRFKCTAAVLL